MRLLRHIVFLRLLSLGLLASLGLGFAAPAFAAQAPLAALTDLDSVPADALERALAKAAGAPTPEALAQRIVASLEQELGTAPPVETLLAALYGSLYRALQDEVGSHAVVAHGSAPGAVATPSAATLGATHGLRADALIEASRPATPALAGPRTLRPALQPLGP